MSKLVLDQVYADEIICHAVTLIRMGYDRLNAPVFAESEEDDITGELVRAIESAATETEAPAWVDYYEVHDQRPMNTGDKLGRSRPKMDIEFRRHVRGKRPCLGFEAKRLASGRHTVGRYLSGEGLRAFVSGYYPTTHGEAGMLGYVQMRDVSEWLEKLSKAISADDECRLTGDLRCFPDEASRCSVHVDESGGPLRIVHVFLDFVVPAPPATTGEDGNSASTAT